MSTWQVLRWHFSLWEIALLAPLLLVGCNAFNTWDAPISEARTKDYPCGIDGVVCVDMTDGGLKPTGMCCDEGQTCGGTMWPHVGCPAGACCDINTTPEMARPLRRQRPAGTWGTTP